MFNAQTDPAGAALKNRAAQTYWDHQMQRAPGGPINSLYNSEWSPFFQALEEAGVDRLADNSVGRKRGMWGGNTAQSTSITPATGEDNSNAFRGNFKASTGGNEIQAALEALRLASTPKQKAGVSDYMQGLQSSSVWR